MTVPSSRMKLWLARIAPIYPGEGRVVALCLLVNLFLNAGITFGRSARDSLFFSKFGIQYLPIMYFFNALFLVLCSVAYSFLADRMDRGKLRTGISMIFIAGLLVSRVILFGHPRYFYPVLYVFAQITWYFSLMQFWTFAGDLFDTRQAKRLFPFLAVGALLGMISVGLTCKKVIVAIGTENVMVVWAGLIFAAWLPAATTYRTYPKVPDAVKTGTASRVPAVRPSEWQKIRAGFREIKREPLLQSMGGYILLMWTVYSVVDFYFNKTVKAQYPQTDELTAFLGHFGGLQGFLCLAVQVLLTRSIIARLGVGTTINFHPACLVLGLSWMSASYGFPSVFSTKLADATMLYTFSDSSYQLLYNPIALERRARIRGFIEGYIRPMSLAASGGLIFLGERFLKPVTIGEREFAVGQQVSWGAVLLAATWLVVATTAKRGYIRALLLNLKGSSPTLRQSAAAALSKMKDPSSLSILFRTLSSEDPEQIVTAIQLLETLATSDAADRIAGLILHPDARVRATATAALGRLGPDKHIEPITSLLADTDPRVRANAVEALHKAGDRNIVEKIMPLLRDPAVRARVNSLLTITALEGVSAARDWIPSITELAHGDSEARSAATYALARLPVEQSMDLLAPLLKDPELRIRCEAAKALRRVGTPRVFPALIEALGGAGELRHDARRAIAKIVERSGGQGTEELARAALETPRAEIRSELADVLGRLSGPTVFDTLIKLLPDPEWRVRWKVLKAFGRLSRSGAFPENARAALFDYAHSELTSFRRSQAISRALLPHPENESERILAEALEEDRLNIEERVFRTLGILCGHDRMKSIFEQLRSADPAHAGRADALEALDNLAPKKIGKEMLAILEPPPLPRGATSAGQPARALDELMHHPKAWLRALTANYLGSNPGADGRGMLLGFLADREPVVREAALYAGWRAFADSWQPQVDFAARSSDSRLARCARRIEAERVEGASGLLKLREKGDSMLLTVEKAVFMKSVSVFASLEGEELAALAEITLEKEFKPGEVIFEEGQQAHHLYVIVEGKVEVFRRVDATEQPLSVLGEREFFGEMAILDDEPRSASIRALEPTLALKVDRESFAELIHERPQIAFSIFKILTHRLRQKNMEADNLPAYEATRHLT